MSKNEKKKIRADFRKNRLPRTRPTNLTRVFQQQDPDAEEAPHGERVSGKGELTRKRTIIGATATSQESGFAVQLDVDESTGLRGRVLAVHGLTSTVQTADGALFQCATRRLLTGQQSVIVGQSGVGKSSVLNAVDPDLKLRVGEISEENEKGTHTTTTARLLPLSIGGHVGGYVVDTPGIRQFQLWDVIPEEVAGYYRDLRPFVNLCRFPNCSHSHESRCAVKDAVADGRLDARRYESYCHLFSGE